MTRVAKRLVSFRREGRGVVGVFSAMGDYTERLLALAHQISPRPELRELDALLSTGESHACAVGALTINAMGVAAISLTAAQAGIHTDDRHGCARLSEIDTERILRAVGQGQIVLVTGFQGVSPVGDLTTLGRGGSDASAVALAAALATHRCEIFTDVAGVFSADPRVVPDARLLGSIGYEEMLLLASSGAAVLQPRSVELAMNHDVEIHVRSAFDPEVGTLVRKETRLLETDAVIGVAHRDRDPIYGVRGPSFNQLASSLTGRGVLVGTLLRRGDELRFTAPGSAEASVLAAIHASGAATVTADDLGSVSIIGAGIGSRPEIASRALATLDGLGVAPPLITNAPGRISWHVPSSAVHDVVRALHSAFELDIPQPTLCAA